ncbi:MAG: hypothetical protein IT380_21505 [Myxococcales bacterium]|nr:hypothetical protein [Myxococcales bacterium]
MAIRPPGSDGVSATACRSPRATPASRSPGHFTFRIGNGTEQIDCSFDASSTAGGRVPPALLGRLRPGIYQAFALVLKSSSVSAGAWEVAVSVGELAANREDGTHAVWAVRVD